MKRSTRARLLEVNEVVSAEELFARLEERTIALSHSGFASDTLCKSDEEAADACLSFRLSIERKGQLNSLGDYCLTSFSS